MPDFFCIGAQRAGTSWLHHQLRRHPRLRFPLRKEPHFWDELERGIRDDSDMPAYLRAFAPQPPLKLGDMTPDYAVLGPRMVERIARLFPEARVVFLMRNPVERAWSAARMAMDYARLYADEVDEAWLATVCRSAACRARGDYESSLRRWRQFYADAQILLVRYEEIETDPRRVLSRVAAHLGVDDACFAALGADELHRRIKGGPPVAMSLALRRELQDAYRDAIVSLADYLQWNLDGWLHSAHDARSAPLSGGG